jgi:hypothetical protein
MIFFDKVRSERPEMIGKLRHSDSLGQVELFEGAVVGGIFLMLEKVFWTVARK